MKNKGKYTLCFDLDNTICKTNRNQYNKSIPDKNSIKAINLLYDRGHIIKIYTARYMGRCDDNIKKANKKIYNFTFKQLKKWNLKFHKLFVTKPSSDIYIDDKAYGYKKTWKKDLLKLYK